MEKLQNLYKKILGMNLAHALVLGLVVKAIVSDISYSAFLLTIPVLAFEGYKLYLKSKKPDPVVIDAEIRKELEAVKSRINLINLEKNQVQQPAKRYF